MPDFRVTWVIEIDANDPVDAARLALEIHRDRESEATFFEVVREDDPMQIVTHVDALTGLTGATEDELADKLPTSEANVDRCFAQGARCGHLEGKGRAGSYVIGEEGPLSYEAADAQTTLFAHADGRERWAAGYRHGYKLAAEGSELEPHFVNAPLP